MKNQTGLNRMIKGGILLGLALVLSYFEMPLLPQAPWLKLDFSALPILFGALAFGSLFGLSITAILQVLIYIVKGSTTGGIGEIANLLMLGTFIVITSAIYKSMKDNKGLIIGSAAGILGLTAAAIIANKFILIPLFFPGGFPGGDAALNTYLFRFIPIFNVIKGFLISLLGSLAYSKIGFLIRKENIEYTAHHQMIKSV